MTKNTRLLIKKQQLLVAQVHVFVGGEMSFTVSAKTRISTAVGNAKYLLYMLANAANHDFECWPSLYTLSAEMGVGLTAVKSAAEIL